MMTDTTPPTSCPACGAPIGWQSSAMFMPKVRIDFECGYVWGNKDGDLWDEKQDCTRAFSAAVQAHAQIATLTSRAETATGWAKLWKRAAKKSAHSVLRSFLSAMRMKERVEVERNTALIHLAVAAKERDEARAQVDQQINARMFAERTEHVEASEHALKVIEQLRAQVTALTNAAQSVADDVCSMLCPSVKKTGTEWTHHEKCINLSAALRQSAAVAQKEKAR